MEHQKPKSASKVVLERSPTLSKIVLRTMRKISGIVGATLGPGGRQVAIERFEHGVPPMVTKDGVTVYRSLGFADPVEHAILEVARDASVRTASEAGDGTSNCAVLSEAIVRLADQYCTAHPRVSPQKVVRHIETQFQEVIEPLLRRESIKITSTEQGRQLMRDVAKISANGDEPLAQAVMECFDLVGDDGNVTIVEVTGDKSSYEVEEIDGYPIPIGYEESCAKYYPKFINDAGTQTCRLDKPVYVLYHGTLTDINVAIPLLNRVGEQFEALIKGQQTDYQHSCVVFVAVGFSEAVLASFSAGWGIPGALKIFPLTIPKSPLANGQAEFLYDLAAITGATVFDPINKGLETGTLFDLGPGTRGFEATRFRSSILGRAEGDGYEQALIDRAEVLKRQVETAASELDMRLTQERLGKLTGGIAKLKVVGSSNGELKEKRDRAEDAVCAVRGALKHGCLPGGGWGLLKAAAALPGNPINDEVLKPALHEPVNLLMTNCGMSDAEMWDVMTPVFKGILEGKRTVYDAYNQVVGDAVQLGVLDSTQAVVSAIRNSLSIASLLGTLGGVVVFHRDMEFERKEAANTQAYLRDVGVNEANERQ